MRHCDANVSETHFSGVDGLPPRRYDANAFEPLALRMETNASIRFTIHCESNQLPSSRS